MAIPSNHELRMAYHMTPLDNLKSIIINGLLSTNQKEKLGILHTNVAEHSIQDRRKLMKVTINDDSTVHDYVPFYFAKKTPMLLNILNKKNTDQQCIIYIAISISTLEDIPGSYFTDSAANTDPPPKFHCGATESSNLEYLNWSIIDSLKWEYVGIAKQQKMAELLIRDQVHLYQIDHIVTWNEYTARLIRKIFWDQRVTRPMIKIAYRNSPESYHYYTEHPNYIRSIITGPFFLNARVKKTRYLIENYQRTNKPKFESLSNAIEAIKHNFSAIKELGNIHGLNATYHPHNGDVAEHCENVAKLVIQSSEYENLDIEHRDVLEFAAYLHDIGKGPKDRWSNHIMHKADGDHPARSLQMLARILIEDLPLLDSDIIRKIIMLVTYDDLLGDIVNRKRDKNQLFKIIKTREDIHMLVALSKADIASLTRKSESDSNGFTPFDVKDTFCKIDYLRNEIFQKNLW